MEGLEDIVVVIVRVVYSNDCRGFSEEILRQFERHDKARKDLHDGKCKLLCLDYGFRDVQCRHPTCGVQGRKERSIRRRVLTSIADTCHFCGAASKAFEVVLSV